MTRWLLTGLLVLAGCAPGGVRVVDGGLLDSDGWPARDRDPETSPYRCPEGTELIDNLALQGRRVVTCRLRDSPVPRGFQLVWNDGGRMVSRLVMNKDGKPLERKQWFDSGRVAGEETYVEGSLVRRVAWYENGEKKADLAYDAEKNLMLVERYQADGAIEARGQTRDGKRIGAWREWRDGALEEVEYIDGFEQGKTVRSYPTGGVEQGQYEAGVRVGRWTRFDSAGNPVREVEYVGGEREGIYRTYHPNTQLREEGRLIDGRKNGVWKSWYPSGELESEHYYACDVMSGPTKTYYASGKLHTAGVFENGRKVGEWKVYSETGIETEIDTHQPITKPFDPADLPTSCDAG